MVASLRSGVSDFGGGGLMVEAAVTEETLRCLDDPSAVASAAV